MAGTVRDAAFDVMRRHGLTRIFGNPGSTEIHFLTDLPQDIEFVLGLHEGAVVGMATGYAIARGRPAFVNLHTAPGLGNAINAIANARDCRAPLVIVVGQQDRRQVAFEPFLTGRALERLAGEYPVWSNLPARAQDVPGAIARAHHEAMAGRGPALVVVPMGDWSEPADELAAASPARVLQPRSVAPEALADLAALLDDARSPALVVGPGTDSEAGWAAVVALAERLCAPVWQESFARRAGFPQDHPQFAGILPWRRRLMCETLAPHDVVVAIGTNAFRLYLLDEPGPMVDPETRVAVISDDPADVHKSPAELGVIAPVAEACAALAAQISDRDSTVAEPMRRPVAPAPPSPGERLTAGHVLAALAERLPPEAVVVEETPSSQPELYRRIPIRTPLGFVAGGNGGLGFGLSGAIGLRMGLPERPVVAVLGDGSAMYAIQGLWSAARYGAGALFVVMGNGRYAIMDTLAQSRGGTGPWPSFDTVDVAGMARCLGCDAVRIETHEELVGTLDDVIPSLGDRDAPLLVEVAVA
ncbi:MAG TPA: thiamine pyrophosphate-binding protein [Solirubrobacteraceae bacterium]|jgi:benzoylformate decarboxylase